MEGLVESEETSVPQDFGEEARVEQVKDRVLNATDVLVDRQPLINGLLGKGQLTVLGVAVAQEIPAGTHEGVHGVGLPAGRFAAAGAIDIDPLVKLGQR